jgi:membrane fusion protein, multidrug efflux system
MRSRRQRVAIRALAAGVLICAVLGGTLISCSKKASETKASQKKPPLVNVALVKQGPISRNVELPGSVRPDVTANVLAPAEGRITSLAYREGDYVSKNSVVARISPSVREDILNAARLKGSEGENLDFAMKQYREIAVVAPINGVVALRNAETGDMVIQRQKLIEIQNMARLHVEVPVPEREIPHIKKGMGAEIRPDALPGIVYKGKVTRVYPRLDQKTRTGTVEVSLPREAAKALKAGMFARVSFILDKVDDAILLPTGAITLSPKGETVVFTVRGGKAAAHTVSIGIETKGVAQILAGVSAGDTIVTAGNEKLKDGSPVRLPGGGKKQQQTSGGAKKGALK